MLLALHAARSSLVGKVRHADVLADPADRWFAAEAVVGLAEVGLARVHLVKAAGRSVAAVLVVSDGSTDYALLSGADPGTWELGAVTGALFHALAGAVERGRTRFDLSTGPDQAKLRWSECVVSGHDFVLVPRGRRRAVAYGVLAALSGRRELIDARRRHVVVPDPS